MKTVIVTIVTIVMLSANCVYGQSIAFEHGPWKNVLEKGSASNKYIFVDFYATWCGPCKYMSRDVFTDTEVGSFFNKNFISFKIDAEKEEQALVESIALDAYPTLVFFDTKGKVLYKHVGALDAEGLIELGKKVSNYKVSRANVLRGTATVPETMEYLTIAKSADVDNYNKIAPTIIEKLKAEDLNDADAWSLFIGSKVAVTQPLFQSAIANCKVLSDKHSNYVEFIDETLKAYFAERADAGDIASLDVYKRSLQTLFSEMLGKSFEYEYFDLDVNADYYLHRKEISAYASALTNWVNKYASDSKTFSEKAIALSAHSSDSMDRTNAIHWAKKAVDMDRNKHSIYSLAVVYNNTGDKATAIQYAESILGMDVDDDERAYIQDYIKQIKG